MKNNLCAVLIPVYKNKLSPLEMISFTQVKKVLGQYEIFVTIPQKLYSNMNLDVRQECFNDEFFTSVQTYSKLLLSKEFYHRFIQFEFVLIYQLDAFVFTDNLEYFCDLGYDYIGAPWIDGMMSKNRNKICFVGNGGLSLRKIKTCIDLLEVYEDEASTFEENEDLFFSLHRSNDFRVASVEHALQFAFESKIKRCYKMNHNQIPFGCHAWERYNFDFWRPYFRELGYEIDDKLIEGGNDDKIIERGWIRRTAARVCMYLMRA